jgi:Glycosyl hydrolases family 28
LLLEGVTFRNSPSWHIHPIDCDLLTIQGISVLAGIHKKDGPNTDGIDPDGCSRVRISDCYIQAGDDAIVLKCTSRPFAAGKTRACRDITVTNCVLITSETALKLGSESYGEFRNITFSNCAIRDAGCGIGLWMRDGGLIDGWVVDNISMTLTGGGEPVYMTQYPRSRLPGRGLPRPDEERPLGTVKNVKISNVEAIGCGSIFVQGMEEKHLEGITLENIRLSVRPGRDKTKAFNVSPPYPFPVWGHKISPYGIYCRYVDDLKLRNVQLTWEAPEDPDWGSAIRCHSVSNLVIAGFTGRQSRGSGCPVILLADTQNAFIHDCWASEDAGTFLRLERGSKNVSLMTNDLQRAEKATQVESGIDATELYAEGNRLRRAT